MARVALIPCASYKGADAAVTAALDLVGADTLFAPGEKILLKPNLLTKAAVDGAVTTHPAVFAAVKHVAQKFNFHPTLPTAIRPGTGSLRLLPKPAASPPRQRRAVCARRTSRAAKPSPSRTAGRQKNLFSQTRCRPLTPSSTSAR